MHSVYDALVIGGGPAGATAACLLARAGWSVVVVERKVFPRPKVCGEYLSATNLPLLERLGVGARFREMAGPAVTRVGLFAGDGVTISELPRAASVQAGWGRALAREHLDSLLLAQASNAGAVICQGSSVTELAREENIYVCRIKQPGGSGGRLHARMVIAAHGSWETGTLPTQTPRRCARAGDLFGFKAHFRNSDLPDNLMPLIAFPGGYGGMVHCEDGRVSISCCVKRDTLARIHSGSDAGRGEAVLGYIMESCRGVRQALAGGSRDGAWLAAGPIRPGIRLGSRHGIFPVGNAAAEAHPVVAEGISMAMQSAWLLAQRLIAWRVAGGAEGKLGEVALDYEADWRRRFAARLYASKLIAHWAMRPAAVATLAPLVRRFPRLLTWGARLSGKTTRVLAS